MRRQNERIKLRGNRFKIIMAVTIAAAACAFAFGAFMALKTTEKLPSSTTPEVPLPSPVQSTTTTPVRKPKSVVSPSAKPRTLPPPNTQNQQDHHEDRD